MNKLNLFRCFAVYVFSSLVILSAPAQSLEQTSTGLINYAVKDESPIKALTAIALQTGVPVGIVLGQDQQMLCRLRRSFDIHDKTPRQALTEVSSSVGFLVKEEQQVLVTIAPDVASWQQEMLDHKFVKFPGYTDTAMTLLGTRLTGAIRMTLGNVETFAASTPHSANAHKISAGDMFNASSEEIANKIVNMDDKGLWIIKSAVNPPSGPANAEIKIYSYADDAELIRDINCAP